MEEIAESAREPIELFEIAPLTEIAAGTGFTAGDLIDFSVGATDGRVYMLFGRDRSETAGEVLYSYAVVELEVDWVAGRCLGRRIYNLGTDYRMKYEMVCAAGEDLLLAGCRCRYNDGDPDRNGLLIGRDGTVRRDYCFGNGVSHCLVMADGTIVTGYTDMGIFDDSAGWFDPPGLWGLVAWRPDGTKLWDGEGYHRQEEDEDYRIWDCYSIARDTQGGLWFYYYDSFCVARTDFRHEEEFRSFPREKPVVGLGDLAVAPSQKRFLCSGGWDFHDRFYLLSRHGEIWTVEAEMIPQLDGVPVVLHPEDVRGINFSDHRTLWLTDSEMLCGYRFV